MARKPRTKPPQSSAFSDAIAFCASILSDKGTVSETHLRIADNTATAFNGILAVGTKCESDITACPQSKTLTNALSKCSDNLSITQLDNRLSIRSDKFRAFVPCIDPSLLPAPIPDPPQVEIDDRLRKAFDTVGLTKIENGEDIVSASLLMNGQSLIASIDGKMIIESWHGLNLPTLSLPKAIIKALPNKPFAKFGCGQFSCTFYFNDGSWLRSQLYAEQWPDVSRVFNCRHDLQPFHVDFFTALAAVAPFGNGLCHMSEGRLSSHAQEGAGAEFSLSGAQGSWCYPSRQLALLKGFASVVDFQAQGAHGPLLYAAGGNTRAVMASVRQYPSDTSKSEDDKIPY